MEANQVNERIEAALAALPTSVLARSGAVFINAPSTLDGQRSLYVLGLNPGGTPDEQDWQRVDRTLATWRERPVRWSAYLDDSWEGAVPGTYGMQPIVKHMFDRLGVDLRETPASNVVFVRSRGEAELAAEKGTLLAACWPVHAAVIETLGVRTLLCLGGTAGRWVRERLAAHDRIDQFKETNDRGWTSEAHLAPDGRAVVTLTHPGRADWRNPAADPSAMVARVLAR